MSCSKLDRLGEIEGLVSLNPNHPSNKYIIELIAMVREKRKIIAEEKALIRDLERKLVDASRLGVEF